MQCARKATTSARPTASQRTSPGQQRGWLTQHLLQQVRTAVCMYHDPYLSLLIMHFRRHLVLWHVRMGISYLPAG